MENTDPIVSICCVTYNHEAFIEQCLRGFLDQKTDFDFEILICDDASTDNTANIIRHFQQQHPGRIKAILHNENQWITNRRNPLTNDLFPNATGRYLALCEGDDYWTDEYKLSKQVRFLEENPDYVLASCRYSIVDRSGKELPQTQYIEDFFRSGKSHYDVTIDNFPDPVVHSINIDMKQTDATAETV